MPVTKNPTKKSAEAKDFLGPFEFHGLTLSKAGSQVKTDCPFCGKNDHLFVNPKNGLWDCKVCGEKGNVYTFLRKLIEVFPADDDALATLAEHRKLPVEAFSGSQTLGYDPDAQRYYLPVFSPEKADTLVGLRVWDGPKKAVFGTTGLPLHLLNAHALLQTDSPDVFICEGDWDVFALDYVRAEVGETAAIIGAPGAQNFKKEWVKYFKDKNVYLCYDNDSPGETGMKRVAGMLATAGCNSVNTINWPVGLKEGYDLSDLVAQRLNEGKSAAQIWEELVGMFVDVEVPGGTAQATKVYDKIPTYKELVKEYGKNVHLDKDMKDALAIVLAVSVSIKLPGDPVWLFLVGPPGSGKTLLLRSMQTSELCQYESNLRPHALVSGMRMEDGSDASLIPQLTGRCLVLKDYTEVRSQGRENQEAIYGIMRGAYDGHVKYTFGNGLSREYSDCWFSMVAGVTHEIHGDNRASLGERFLKCELLGDDHDSDIHIRAAMDSCDRVTAKELQLREKVAAFLSQSMSIDDLPSIPEWVKVRLIALAQIVAMLRTSTNGSKGELLFRPRSEIGTRLAKQLVKLGRCIAYITEKSTIDKECYRLMEKVALDTAHGFHQDIMKVLMKHHPKPVTIKEICVATHLTRATLDRRMQALVDLKQVVRAPIKKVGGGSGQPELGYLVAPAIVKLWQQAKIGVS